MKVYGAVFPCEEVVRKYLPAVRASVAKKLYKKGWKQQRIATALGLTQAAVSKYLSNLYGKEIRKVEADGALDAACGEIAHKIERGEWKKEQVVKAICVACARANTSAATCGVLIGA